MKIFLIYPRLLSLPYDQYNHGLGYIAAVLKQKGHDVRYIVLKDKHDVRSLYESVRLGQPGIVAFSATSSQFNHLGEIVETIKHISNAFVLLGGVHATVRPECISEIPRLDAIVRGEGEIALTRLAEALENERDYRGISNLWFNEGDTIIKNGVGPLIEDLDDLPFPDRSSLEFQRTIDENNGKIRLIFSRGCTYRCAYCSNRALSNVYGGGYFRARSPQKAIEEIALVAGSYTFEYIFFDDDTIHLNKSWFYEFFGLYRKNFKVPFGCNIRPDAITSDMIRFLKDSGARKVHIGVEHGNEELRRTVLKRNMPNSRLIDVFSSFDRYGIECFAHLMVGLPFENKSRFLDTVRLCRKLPIGVQSVHVFCPYPGTELGELCERNGWLPGKKLFVERREAIVSYPDFESEEIQLCRDVFPALLRFGFIPLRTPLKAVLYFDKAVALRRKVWKLFRGQVRWRALPARTYGVVRKRLAAWGGRWRSVPGAFRHAAPVGRLAPRPPVGRGSGSRFARHDRASAGVP